jgi:hypothetical protein
MGIGRGGRIVAEVTVLRMRARGFLYYGVRCHHLRIDRAVRIGELITLFEVQKAVLPRCPSGSARCARGSSPVSGNMCRAVPTLIDGDVKLFQSVAIIEYLDEKFESISLRRRVRCEPH